MATATQKARTKQGYQAAAFIFLTIFVLLEAAAFNTGENLLYLIAALTASFMLLALVLIRSTGRGITATRHVPDAVHRDDPFTITYTVTNNKRILPGFSIRVGLAGNAEESVYVPVVPPRSRVTTRLQRTMPKRGLHTLPPTQLVSAFPMGLFRHTRTVGDESTVLVYPRVHRVDKSVLNRLDDSGPRPKVAEASGDEFHSLREYVPGDDIRYISWRVSARVGELIVREQEPSSARTTVIILDTRGVPETQDEDDKFEQAIELAASLALAFLENQYTVSLVTPDAAVPPGQGESHMIRVLELLARIEPTRYGEVPDDWFRASGDVAGAAKVCIATDSSQWGGRGLGGSVQIVDPIEVLYAS